MRCFAKCKNFIFLIVYFCTCNSTSGNQYCFIIIKTILLLLLFPISLEMSALLFRYLLQVWYGQQLLQPGQELRHQLLQSLVIDRAIICRKNLLWKKPKLCILNYQHITVNGWFFDI